VYFYIYCNIQRSFGLFAIFKTPQTIWILRRNLLAKKGKKGKKGKKR